MRIIIFLLSSIFCFSSLLTATSPLNYDYKENVRVDVKPELIYQPKMEFSSGHNSNNKPANIWISALINLVGNVLEANIDVPCDDSIFNKLALDSAYSFKFKPAIKDGRPEGYWVWWKVKSIRKVENNDTTLIVTVNNNDNNGYLPKPNWFIPFEIMPEITYFKEPTYSKDIENSKIKGNAIVKVLVDWEGDFVKAQIAKSSGNELLDKAALDAAPKNKYKPAIQNGKPVAFWIAYKVDFKLDN